MTTKPTRWIKKVSDSMYRLRFSDNELHTIFVRDGHVKHRVNYHETRTAYTSIRTEKTLDKAIKAIVKQCKTDGYQVQFV